MQAMECRIMIARCVALLLLLLVISGCVILPYRPHADTTHETTDLPEPERLRLTIGPRTLLEDLAKDVSKKNKRIESADAQSFIDAASPDAELTLARLLEPTARARIEPLGLDYLVVVGEPKEVNLYKKGGMAFYIGFLGLAISKDKATIQATIFDLHKLQLLEKMTSTSTGTSASAGAFYALFIVSDPKGAARKDLIAQLAMTLSKEHPEGPVRVVFLAAEIIDGTLFNTFKGTNIRLALSVG